MRLEHHDCAEEVYTLEGEMYRAGGAVLPAHGRSAGESLHAARAGAGRVTEDLAVGIEEFLTRLRTCWEQQDLDGLASLWETDYPYPTYVAEEVPGVMTGPDAIQALLAVGLRTIHGDPHCPAAHRPGRVGRVRLGAGHGRIQRDPRDRWAARRHGRRAHRPAAARARRSLESDPLCRGAPAGVGADGLETVRALLRIVHVFGVVYWLGADLVVFYLGFGARDRTAPVLIREERLRIMAVVDRCVVIAFKTTYISGLLLLLFLDMAPLQAVWFQVKLALAALIFVAGLLLVRVGAVGSLKRALAAAAVGDAQTDALEADAWRRRIPSRAYVLAIYGMALTVLALAVTQR